MWGFFCHTLSGHTAWGACSTRDMTNFIITLEVQTKGLRESSTFNQDGLTH